MNRLGSCVAVLSFVLAACTGEAPPNLLLVSIDTLRADKLEVYGQRRPTSPAIAAFAAQGLVVETALSTSPWTLPAHASLLTGLYPSRHGVRSMLHGLPAAVEPLAERLAAAGYHTGAIVNSRYLANRYGWHRGFDAFEHVPETAGRIAPTEVHGKAVAWLEAVRERPFFLFLHYYDVHSDYRSLPRYERELVRRYKGPVNGSTKQLLRYERGEVVFDNQGKRNLVDRYVAGIRQMDDGVGALLAKLDELGLVENTLVVLTSDHGEEFLEHDGVLHGRTLHEEVVRVPLILRGPGVPIGQELGGLASLVDVVPTVLSLLGLPAPAEVDGVDLSQYFTAGLPAERSVFSEADHKNERNDALRGIRRGDWKLVLDRFNGELALYDLAADPGERDDVSERRPEVVRELRAGLDAFMARPAVAESRVLDGLQPRELEQLRALGYL
ncbi:MAG: sulfatase [Deltaproteobacteria bacterium]|nr:sulfatase [Deltaproteobacteria bacterium]MBW2363269.1 sulfatase [Deltaproteobacteria bacterium]